jgi:hypothetical protein
MLQYDDRNGKRRVGSKREAVEEMWRRKKKE